jgi:hypothetical protein
VRFSFRADFNTGNYYISARLEDRASDINLMPVDKQVGALSFTINRAPHLHFIGLVNVPIEAVEIL